MSVVKLPQQSEVEQPSSMWASWFSLRRSPYGLSPVLVLSAMGLFSGLATSVVAITLPNIAQELSLDIPTLAGIVSTLGVILIAFSIAVGWLGDRVSRTKLLGAGLVVHGLGNLFAWGVQSVNQFYLALGLNNGGGALDSVPGFSLTADFYPTRYRGRAFSALGALSGAGVIFGALLIPGLLAVFGWRGAYAVTAVPVILLGVGIFFFLKHPIRGYWERVENGLDAESARIEDPPLSFAESVRATLAVRTVRRLIAADAIGNIPAVASGILVPLYLSEVYGLNAVQRGLIQIPAAFAILIGNYLGGTFIDFFSRKEPASIIRILALFSFIGTLGSIGLAFQPPLVVLIVVNTLSALGGALTTGTAGAVYSQIIPPNVRTLGLTILRLVILPGLVMQTFFAGIEANYGWQPMWFAMVPFSLIGVAIYLTSADLFDGDRRNVQIATTSAEEARQLKRSGSKRVLMCRQVNVFYDEVQVLFNVDLDVERGEVLALLGTNGAGKSTLLRAVSGTQPAADGTIIFDGRDITHMPPYEIAARGIVHMPGGRGIFPGLTVEDNLKMGTWLRPDANITALLAEAYETFPILQQRAHQPAGLLSGGEQQMVALAQAFMAKPQLLMIDELSLGLSPAVVGGLLEMVKKINENGTTVIVVEQSVNVALTLAKRAVFMEKGEVKFDGPTAELLRRPDILRAVYVKGTGALTTAVESIVGGAAKRRRENELAAAQTVLEVNNVVKRFGGVVALKDVSLTLRDGEILGLIGPNGSGKTTLFDVISGYQAPDLGSVVYLGQDITALPPHERAKRKLVRRFQDARLFPSLTVGEVLLVALDQRLEVRNFALGALSLPGARRAERRARVRADRLIELLELQPYRDKFVRELSTGLRRIVDLAFVLATEPKVLLLDEPSSGIAQAEAESLGPLLQRVRHETGCSILLIEHDMPLISSVADEMIAMVTGTIVTRGPASEVLNDQRVVEAFLGGSEAAVQRSGSLKS